MTIRIKKIHEDDISKEICNSLRIESSIEQAATTAIASEARGLAKASE